MSDEAPSSSNGSPTGVAGVREQSARALLLVLLGEFVWPTVRPFWSAALLEGLAELGEEENAARKALQRTADIGVITSTREGRRVKWTITARGRGMLAAGQERIYGWEARDTSWDGQWLILNVTVPESQRRLRHHLQTRLGWAGLGSPAPGQWLTPHHERSAEVASIIEELGLQAQSHSFIGVVGPVGDEGPLVTAAWDLHGLVEEYRTFIDTYSSASPGSDAEAFVSRVHLVQAWRRFPYRDPDLPARFLPASWPGAEAARVFRASHNALVVGSTRHWNYIQSKSG